MIDRNNILIVLPYFSLLFIGLVMVASSSIFISEDIYGTPFHFASRQIIFFIIGVFATIIALIAITTSIILSMTSMISSLMIRQ